jgi:hypothetical protein
MIPSFLVLSWALTFGYLPSGSNVIGSGSGVENPVGVNYSNSCMQTIELGLTAWDTVTIWTNIETYDTVRGVGRFAPFRSDYNIGLNIGREIAGFRLDAGVSHECIHPVMSDSKIGKWVAGGDTEIYVKISGKIGGK